LKIFSEKKRNFFQKKIEKFLKKKSKIFSKKNQKFFQKKIKSFSKKKSKVFQKKSKVFQKNQKFVFPESIPDSAPSYDFRLQQNQLPNQIIPPIISTGQSGPARSLSHHSLREIYEENLEDLGIVGHISFERSDQSNETSDECMFPAVGKLLYDLK